MSIWFVYIKFRLFILSFFIFYSVFLPWKLDRRRDTLFDCFSASARIKRSEKILLHIHNDGRWKRSVFNIWNFIILQAHVTHIFIDLFSETHGNGEGNSLSNINRLNRQRITIGKERTTLRLSAVAASCSRIVLPGITGDRAYNLTMNGIEINFINYLLTNYNIFPTVKCSE